MDKEEQILLLIQVFLISQAGGKNAIAVRLFDDFFQQGILFILGQIYFCVIVHDEHKFLFIYFFDKIQVHNIASMGSEKGAAVF